MKIAWGLAALPLAVLLAPVTSARTPEPAPRCAASRADAGAIATAIRAWYAAVGQDDAVKVHAYVAPDFQIFDAGKRLTADELIDLARRHLADGSRASWTISDPDVHVDCNTALASFSTLGSFDHAGQHQDVRFLESAVLKKAQGKWRILFFHSTAVPPSAPTTPNKQ